MSRVQADRHSLKRAFAISVALHLLFGPILVVSSAAFDGKTSGDRGDLARESTTISYLTITHRAAVRPAAPALPIRPRGTVPRTIPVPARAPATRLRSHVAQSTREPGARFATAAVKRPARPGPRTRVSLALTTPAPDRLLTIRTLRAIPVARASEAPTEKPTASAVTPSPASSVAVASEVATRGIDIPAGGWGQSFESPLVADEIALEALRVKYRGSREVSIEVDESGRATRVTFSNTVPSDVRAELERHLREMRYVPAECNGLRCNGTLQITL